MLNHYQDLMHPDPAKQNSLDVIFQKSLSEQFTANLAAFSQYCPSILNQLVGYKINQYNLFCTQLGQANLLDLTNGQALYSNNPKNEINNEVESFLHDAVVVSLKEAAFQAENTAWPTKALAASSTILLFGLGLGYQVQLLLEQRPPAVLVIYEPNHDFFYSSMQVIDWANIYQLAELHGTLISIQLGSDGNNVNTVIADLRHYQPDLKEIFIYRHIAHPVMDEVIHFLLSSLARENKACGRERHFIGFNEPEHFVASRVGNVLGNIDCLTTIDSEAKGLFKTNIAAFKQYYPELSNIIANYQPKHWFFVRHKKQANLWHKQRNVLLYQSSTLDAEKVVNDFIKKPYQDDLLLGQKVVDKFKHYVHYKHIAKLQNTFSQIASKSQRNINQLSSLIIFGIGCGEHISQINHQTDIKQLYIFEPNVDYLYASLFCFNWQALFDEAAENNQQIYLNIGGSDDDYFADVMQQFYRNGLFAIADTYMLQAYDSPFLAQSIKLLKQQLKVVLAMGDYYDYARFGISHTYDNFRAGHYWLKADRALYSQHPATDIPVFIVGNGPSLDHSIEFLKQHRDNAIVISCGTALKALHALGITPDFHAEVEQNRSTYRWITQVNDVSYLKSINAISVNGLHPDTANLFAEVFLAFKAGEAAAYVFKKLLDGAADIANLTYAYPTVSNLAVNFALHAGFKQVYLFGVDLGYIDVDNHHSQFSAYYDQQGKSVYNYRQEHGDGIEVSGNFRPTVLTKVEFDVSRQIMEQTIAAFKSQVEVYNCSDGAKIKGAITLQPANILISNNLQDRKSILEQFLQAAFYQNNLYEQSQLFLKKYNVAQFKSSIRRWCDLIQDEVTDIEGAETLLEQQWALFRALSMEPGSLLFPLLHGSTTYILGVLTKLISLMADNESFDFALEQYNYVMAIWIEYLNSAADDLCNEPLKLDITI
ncbi:6-hydroxymethylpterin diphosphokinase MptE-like protein [Rheinheimera sp. WS51]|uniref:6-hydroxymethylpterin diphosphokinase MptE-like protein n=1 Tax=Rheinheimera sp. WS51 TaxID=3425886 RepID=UPI003D8FC1FB